MALQPTPADKFTFGLWTVGNRGRDPFGEFVRPALDPCEAVRRLADLGAWGVNFHDNDLVPIDATPADRDRIVGEFRRTLESTGMTVPMATTNLFTDPVFKDGAFTAHDPQVRAYALQKTMRAMDLGVELGARTYVFWGGREGAEVDAAKDPVEAIKRFRGANKRHASSGNNAFLHRGLRRGHGIFNAVLLFFHLDFGRGPNFNDGHATGKFCQTLLKFFLIVIRIGRFDLTLDLGDTAMNLRFLALAADNHGRILG